MDMKFKEEINLLTELIHTEPENEEHLERRGDLYFRMEDFNKALTDHTNANSLAQGESFYIARCLCDEGKISEQDGRDDDALEYYEMAIGFDFSNGYYHFCKSCIEFKQKKIDDAMESLSQALGYGFSDGPEDIPKSILLMLAALKSSNSN